MQLYPLKFEPVFVQKVWGNQRLKKLLNKNTGDLENIGESWELSALQGNLSVVANGFLAGNNIQEIAEVYLSDLLGERIYYKYGIEFPLLFKFIDANDKLSIQVHPDNETAKFRHYAYGKTEMWYVVDAEPDAEIILGFKKSLTKVEFLQHLEDNTFLEFLNFEKVKKGDVFYIPAGRVHALGKGVLVAEIQQTSDITYRLYDWDRVGLDGKPRELHIDLALDVMDFSVAKSYKTLYDNKLNQRNTLVESPYFTTNLLEFDKALTIDYSKIDSFVVYMCLEGELEVSYGTSEPVKVTKGETVLIPAEAERIFLKPHTYAKILETYIPFVYLDADNEI